MNQNPIRSQIEGLGYRRLAVWVGVYAIGVLVAGVALGLVVKHINDKSIRLSVALILTGLLLGFATSMLTPSSRKIARNALVALGLTLSLTAFSLRVLFGWSHELSLALSLSPLMLPLGYIIGQFRASRV